MTRLRIDKEKLADQFRAIRDASVSKKEQASPAFFASREEIKHPCAELLGKKIGCLVMAGGQATRLGLNTPKGILPISPVHKKSLFQILAEKLVAYGQCYKETPRLGIMTSEFTDASIRDHFEKNQFFGLRKDRVDFFVQPSLPFISLEGRPVFDAGKKLLTGPDGNGALFSSFVSSFTYDSWEQEQIEAVSVCMIDNPLLDPFYPAMILPVLSGVDITAAAIRRINPQESVGVFAVRDDRLCVVEYSELSEEDRTATKDGDLLFQWANISFFVTSLSFIKHVAFLHMPLHVAKKQVQNNWVWKAEYFIFDYLPYAKKTQLFALDRKRYFCPIKAFGDIALVQQALMEKDLMKQGELTEEAVTTPLELPQSAYYPTF